MYYARQITAVFVPHVLYSLRIIQ